jgi:hypothetical protein
MRAGPLPNCVQTSSLTQPTQISQIRIEGVDKEVDLSTSGSSTLVMWRRNCHKDVLAATTGAGTMLPSTAAKAMTPVAHLISHMLAVVVVHPVRRRDTCTDGAQGVWVPVAAAASQNMLSMLHLLV